MATRGKKEKEYPPMPANWMYKRGDVYMMDLNPYSGSEQGGVRPAIVVQNDDGNFYSNVLLVVPLTTQIKNEICRLTLFCIIIFECAIYGNLRKPTASR